MAVDARKQIEKLIAKKTQEVEALTARRDELNSHIERLHAHIEAHTETLKLFPKESVASTTVNLKKGSEMERTYIFLRGLGRPAHVNEILAGINKDANPKSRASIASSIASYAREGKVFTKAGPYIFGLAEFGPKEESPFDDQARLEVAV